MKTTFINFAVAVLNLIPSARSVVFQVEARRKYSSLRTRATAQELVNGGDITYTTNLTLGGVPFKVLIDTGSSDLWVAGTVPNSKPTQFTSGVQYAVGAVQGPVKTGELVFAGYTIPDQAFLEIAPSADNAAGEGIIGLGPNSGSTIFQKMQSSAGATVLDRIFLQDTSTPNFLTVLLGRIEDPTDAYTGSLTVGEVLPDFVAVQQEPQLPVTDVPIRESGDQHFQVLLDQNGLIGPDGNPIPIVTAVDETANKRQATVVVDTGFSLPQIPSAAAQAIYSGFSGAELVNIKGLGKVWVLPCVHEVNITFVFGGKQYPIHPLDTALNPVFLGIDDLNNSQGEPSCIGSFQPFSFNTGSSPNYDMILGMGFLRNVYMLVNFGDFVVGSTTKKDPFIQFLSTTDLAEAHSDFVRVRLNGNDTTTNVNNKNPNTNKNKNQGFWAKSRTLYFVLTAIAVLAILATLGAWALYRSRQNRRGRGTAASNAGTYQPLHYPAPNVGHSEYPSYSSSQAPYQYTSSEPQYQLATYNNPWDGRR